MLETAARLYGVTLLAAIAAYPLARRVFGDRGGTAWGAARYLGTLSPLFMLWMAVQAGPGRVVPAWSWGVLAASTAAVWGLELRSGHPLRTLRCLADRQWWRHEVVFVVLLIACSWIFHFNPAIDPDSERFMDFAMLEAVASSEGFVVGDPWFAGEPLQYYYFGYYWVGFIHSLAVVEPLTGFVPITALLYALFGGLLFSLGTAVRGRSGDGVLALLLVMVCGNVQSFLAFVEHPSLTAYDWFAPSRVIAGTINEFPFFSLLYGDLHPYVIGFPLLALMLMLVHQTYLDGPPSWRSARFWCTALAFGLSASVNSWDLPVLAMVYAFALYLHASSRRARRLGAAGSAIGGTAVTCCLGVLPFLPYLVLFQSGGRTLAWVDAASPWQGYLAVHGMHWFILGACAIWALCPPPLRRRWLPALLGLCVLAGLLLFAGVGVAAAAAAVAAWLLAERRPPASIDRLGWALVAAAMLLTAAVEVVHVDDLFAGSYERVVTVFKVYLQAWILLGVACTMLLASLGRHRLRVRRVLVAVVLVVGLVYPVAGTASRLRSLAAAHTLTTRQHLEQALGPEVVALDWLAANARTGDVVLEAPGPPYGWNGRMATFTPAATMLAWDYHEATWRNSLPLVREREALVDRLFTDADPETTRALLAEHEVRFVVVGRLERERYGEQVMERFSDLGEVVVEEPGVRLIRLRGRGGSKTGAAGRGRG
jgi:YYY domain-containing protein